MLLAVAVYLVSLDFAPAAETPAAGPTSKSSKPKEVAPEKKKLTGAALYAMHCNRCHPERYAPEWNSAQWKTIITHMRVRANLPAAQAKEILKFLQDEAGH